MKVQVEGRLIISYSADTKHSESKRACLCEMLVDILSLQEGAPRQLITVLGCWRTIFTERRSKFDSSKGHLKKGEFTEVQLQNIMFRT